MIDPISIVQIYPALLGLYGDTGNALVLAHRAMARNLPAQIITVEPGEALPRHADIYLIGGGEDASQAEAAALLRADGGIGAIINAGIPVLAVCAGLQILGVSFGDPLRRVEGLGLVDVTTYSGRARAVGELVIESAGLPVLSGFENHSGRTVLGPDVQRFGTVRSGVGNGDVNGSRRWRRNVDRPGDGFKVGRTIGTYLHGPVLARNPALADLLLEWVTGAVLHPLSDCFVDALRLERLGRRQSTGQPRRLRGRWRG